MKYVNKDNLIVATGAGVGTLSSIMMRQWADVNYGTIPGISGIIPAPWDRYSTLGNIIIGGLTFGIGTFAGLSSNISGFLQGIGIVSLIAGLTFGVFPETTTGYRSRARLNRSQPIRSRRPIARRRNLQRGFVSQQGQSAAYKRASITTRPNAPHPVTPSNYQDPYKARSIYNSPTSNNVTYTPTYQSSNKILA